jgi:hypothetical protein
MSEDRMETVEELRADREKVVLFVEHLRRAFEDYVNTAAENGKDHEIGYTDALMAVHNFHKLIVLDIEERTGLRQQGNEAMKFFRQMWVDTFRIALTGRDEEKAAIRAKNQS